MSFVVTISSSDGSEPRPLTGGQSAALVFGAERTRDEGYASFTLKIPARFDELTEILFGDRVEATFGGVLHYRGYVYSKHRSYSGDTPELTIAGFGAAKRAYQCETLGEYNYSDAPVDRSVAWAAIAAESVSPELPAITLSSVAVGVNTDRVEGTYKTFRDVVNQLASSVEDIVVAGGDVFAGTDRLFYRPAATSATYTFPVPDPSVNPQTRGLTGGVSLDSVFNRLRIRGGAPAFPQFFPNAHFDRLTGFGSDSGVTGDGLELAAKGTATITAKDWRYEAGGHGKNAVRFSGTAADTTGNDIIFRPARAGNITLAATAQKLRFEARVQGLSSGDLPKLLLVLEWLDTNGKHISYSTGTIAAASDYDDLTTITYSVTAPPATAAAVAPSLHIRGNVTDMVIDAVSLRDYACVAEEWINNGAFTVLLDSDNVNLVDSGIIPAAADSSSLYTDGARQMAILEDETVTSYQAAYDAAAVWFNRNAIPFPDPSLCRIDDAVEYWPGDGVALTGADGTALMAGLAFLPIASVKLQFPAYGGAYEQKIELKRQVASTKSALSRAIREAVTGIMSPETATLPSTTGAGAAGGSGGSGGSAGGGGGASSPDGLSPKHDPDAVPGFYDPVAGYVNSHGTLDTFTTSTVPADITNIYNILTSITGVPAGIGCTFEVRPWDAVGEDCFIDSFYNDQPEAQAVTRPQCWGTITGWTIKTDATETLTISVDKAGEQEGTGGNGVYGNLGAFRSITGGDDPTMTADTEATSSSLAAWDTAFREGDAFRFTLSDASGSGATRAEILLTVTVNNTVLAA